MICRIVDGTEKMNIGDVMIRNATIDDAKRLLEIYAYYVKNTAISFEYDVPSRKPCRRVSC